MSIALARLRRLRLLVRGALTHPKVRRNQRAGRPARRDKPPGGWLWRPSARPTARLLIWAAHLSFSRPGRADASQPSVKKSGAPRRA